MGPFDRFNDRAKRVLALSQDEAIRFNHDYIAPEHLLLGLVREGEGVAARALDSLGVQLSKVRLAVEQKVGRGEATQPTDITLTPATKRVIDFAVEEAKRLGHAHVATEHLLLGLVRKEESIAAQILQSLGVTLEGVRRQTIATLGDTQDRASRAWAAERAAARTAPPEVQRQLFDAQGKKRDWYCEDVLSGKLAVEKLYEDQRVLGIRHPYPQYRVHGVVIPKSHVASLMAPEAVDGELLASMLKGVQAVARALGLDSAGFRLEANAIAPGVTPHMHWHVVGPGLPPPLR
jgi:ATP-dependent Clp protease ATP-binding subunit ClpC